jgi:hypothetical protein
MTIFDAGEPDIAIILGIDVFQFHISHDQSAERAAAGGLMVVPLYNIFLLNLKSLNRYNTRL